MDTKLNLTIFITILLLGISSLPAWVSAGELVSSELAREKLYPNVVSPKVVFGGNGSAPAQLSDVQEVVFRDNNTFYVAECGNNRVQEFDINGSFVHEISGIPCPTDIAMSSDEQLIAFSAESRRFYVVDTRLGSVLQEWSSPVEMTTIGAVTATSSEIYVLPEQGQTISVLGLDGEFLRSISVPAFELAVDMKVHDDGIYVSDKMAAHVYRLNTDGSVREQMGRYGTYAGELANPHGIDVVGNTILVADTVNHRAQQFDVSGEFVLQWGRHPVSPQRMGLGRMHYPHNIASSPDGRHIVVCEPYEARCNLFEREALELVYQDVDESAWWDKFFYFHYRGPAREVAFRSVDPPLEHDLLIMGEEDIHRVVISKVVNGIPETITYFGEFGSGPGQFKGPEGLAVGPNGDLYVMDTQNHRIQVFDLNGNYKREFGTFGSGPSEFNSPGQGSTDSSGRLYVSDSGNHRIQVVDPDGSYLFEWGSIGDGPGEFNRPIDAYVDRKNDRVLVVDLYNYRVQVFDLDGNYLFEFGGKGTDIGEFTAPHSVVVDPETDMVFVSDMIANSVQKFTLEGGFVGRYGQYGVGLGEFKTPAGLSILGENLFVMDHTNHRGQILDKTNGAALAEFGEEFIGVPNDILAARARLEALENEIRALTRPGGSIPALEAQNILDKIESIREDIRSRPLE